LERRLERSDSSILLTTKLTIDNPQFVIKHIIRREDDSVVSVATWPVDDVEMDYGGTVGKTFRAKMKAILTAVNIESTNGIKCMVSFQQYFDLGGSLQTPVISSQISRSLKMVKNLQNAFDKDQENDRAVLTSLANIMKNVPQTYTEEEARKNGEGKKFFEKVRLDEERKTAGVKNGRS